MVQSNGKEEKKLIRRGQPLPNGGKSKHVHNNQEATAWKKPIIDTHTKKKNRLLNSFFPFPFPPIELFFERQQDHSPCRTRHS